MSSLLLDAGITPGAPMTVPGPLDVRLWPGEQPALAASELVTEDAQ